MSDGYTDKFRQEEKLNEERKDIIKKLEEIVESENNDFESIGIPIIRKFHCPNCGSSLNIKLDLELSIKVNTYRSRYDLEFYECLNNECQAIFGIDIDDSKRKHIW